MLWEVKRQADLGVLRTRKDFMTVMMFALYLKWRVCGNRSGGQQGKEQEERHRGFQQWGWGAQRT